MVQVLAQNLVDPYPMESREGKRCTSAWRPSAEPTGEAGLEALAGHPPVHRKT